MHGFVIPIDDPVNHISSLVVCGSEIANVFGNEVSIKAGNKDTRTQNLGKT